MADVIPSPAQVQVARTRKAFFLQILLGIALLAAAGMGFYNGWKKVKADVLVIPAFHGITENPMWGWEIKPPDFDRYLEGFKTHDYLPLAPDTFAEWRSGAMAAGRRFLMTFDDGLQSSGEAARRLKKEHGIDSILFIVTDFIGKPGYLSADEIRQLASTGLTIGLHGKRHLELPALIASGADLLHELRAAREELETLVGKPVRWFAYPFGVFSASATAAVASAGLSYGLTVDPGSVRREDPPLLMPRVMYLRGAEKAGEPVLEDWLPPIEAKNGGLMMTLGFFVVILSLRSFQRAWLLFGYLRSLETSLEKPAAKSS